MIHKDGKLQKSKIMPKCVMAGHGKRWNELTLPERATYEAKADLARDESNELLREQTQEVCNVLHQGA